MARERGRDLHEAQVPGAPEGMLRDDLRNRQENRVARNRARTTL